MLHVRVVVVGMGALGILAACGSSKTSDATQTCLQAAADFSTCGGDYAGTWVAQAYCQPTFDSSLSSDLTQTCVPSTTVVTGSPGETITIAGSHGSGTFTVTTGGPMIAKDTFPASCLVSLDAGVTSCAAFKGAYGSSAASCTDSTSTPGDCTCTRAASNPWGITQGSKVFDYTTSGMGNTINITVNNGFVYLATCVQGNILLLHQQNWTYTYQRQ